MGAVGTSKPPKVAENGDVTAETGTAIVVSDAATASRT
jgi:hypothetical protein